MIARSSQVTTVTSVWVMLMRTRKLGLLKSWFLAAIVVDQVCTLCLTFKKRDVYKYINMFFVTHLSIKDYLGGRFLSKQHVKLVQVLAFARN